MGELSYTKIPIAELKQRNERAGHYFFSKETTRFFRSRYPENAYTADKKKAYFITSEQREDDSPRLYSIRVYNLETDNVKTIGETQEHPTRDSAWRTIRDLLAEDSKGV